MPIQNGNLAAGQINTATTAGIGPNGPIRQLYAVGVETAELAMEQMARRLEGGELANWIGARHLSVSPGEIRQI